MKTQDNSYTPLLHIKRGDTVESIHYGTIVVIRPDGELVASCGDPDAVTFLRSTAKPFQALPFIEQGGAEQFNLTPKEIAIMCASHSGTDDHVRTLVAIQKKVGIHYSQLLCGTHPPYHNPTAALLADRGEQPNQNHHNCSGKHTGMVAFSLLLGAPLDSYTDPHHPVQENIIQVLSEMCSIPRGEIQLGIDGCSVPVFAMPMRSAALGLAKLADPADLPEQRSRACRTITSAMRKNPMMVAGPGRLDTCLMEHTQQKITSKAGAEAFQGLAIHPGAAAPGSTALGVAIKIADGDRGGRAMGPVVIETLKQLGVLTDQELESLESFGPEYPILNHRKMEVGRAQPCFSLHDH